MNAEKYTQKSLEAVREAQELVIRNQNMQIDQQHLLYALLTQEAGLSRSCSRSCTSTSTA